MLVEENTPIDTTYDYESDPASEKDRCLNFKVELELMRLFLSLMNFPSKM